MSMHDNFLDVRDAWRAYNKAYGRWGKAVDGTLPNLKPAPEAEQVEAALAMAETLHYIESMASNALKDMKRYGWPIKRPPPQPMGNTHDLMVELPESGRLRKVNLVDWKLCGLAGWDDVPEGAVLRVQLKDRKWVEGRVTWRPKRSRSRAAT